MSKRTNHLVKIAVLSAAAFVVMFLETPPLFSTFLKMDFSDIFAVIGGFAINPLAAVIIQLIKNLLHLSVSQTSGVGELGNFIVGSAFAYSAALVYHRRRTKRQAIVSLVVGTVSMVMVALLANYLILLPLYAKVLGFTMEAVIGATQVVNPYVTDIWSFLLFAIAPFNVIKGIVLSVVTFLIYKKLSKMLERISL